jgi:hypothetical protein
VAPARRSARAPARPPRIRAPDARGSARSRVAFPGNGRRCRSRSRHDPDPAPGRSGSGRHVVPTTASTPRVSLPSAQG